MAPLNALIVSVDYAHELALTLPRNRKHFDRVLVITSPRDTATCNLAKENHASYLQTDAFSSSHVTGFAKDAAIRQGLQQLGPVGWIMHLDADILLPDALPMPDLEVGTLYGAKRRLCSGWTFSKDWAQYPYQPDSIMAGYCQLYHSSDPNVQPWPNYPVEKLVWYSDTVFQDRWPPERKVWLPFDVLHIGDPPRQNWCGRSLDAQKQLANLLGKPANLRWRSKWRH